MQYSSSHFFSPFRTLLRRLEKPLGGLLLATGMITIAAAVQAAEIPLVLRQIQSSPSVTQPIEDGVYLYGQSSTPEQIGSAYMVFRVGSQQVVGAFYMPSSSFDCFHGDLKADQLALTVINSEEQAAYPYSVALQPGSNVASADGSVAPLQLAGYHRITTVSENDRRILATCLADNQQQVPTQSLQGQE